MAASPTLHELLLAVYNPSTQQLATSGSGGGGGGLSVVDEAAFTAGTSNFTPVGGAFNDAAAPLTTGQQGTERLTPNRAQHTNLRTQDGTEISGKIGALLPTAAVPAGFSDGVNMRPAYVSAFHNSDNQVPTGTQYGLLTGGIAQILNPIGNLDRQRGTGFDGIPAVGIATGTQQLAGNIITTTFNATVTGNANAQSIVVTSSASIKVGDIIITQDNPEYVEITAVTDATHITGVFKNAHASGQTLSWFHYNQARDASIGDNVIGTGVSPSATYLFNTITNKFEFDRSALGELDGANGQGTAVAAEYEFNGNIPAYGGTLSGFNFDRARNVQAGGLGSATISNNPLAANVTSLTLNSAPTTLQSGMQIIIDRAGTNPETNIVGTGYTFGSTTVPLQIATQFSHAQNVTVEWSQHAPLGPQLNGFLPSGLGMEEEIVYDPISKKYFVEISATADGNSPQNLVLEALGLFNGTTMDRLKGTANAAWTLEQKMPVAEDNVNGLMATLPLPLVSSTYDKTPYTVFGSLTNQQIKATAAQLYSFDLSSTEATSLYYFQLFNATSPTGTPFYSWALGVGTATSPFYLERGADLFGVAGRNFSTALSWGISSTKAAYTAAGTAANYQLHLHYK